MNNYETHKQQVQANQDAKKRAKLVDSIVNAAKKHAPKPFAEQFQGMYTVSNWTIKALKLVSMLTIGYAVFSLVNASFPFGYYLNAALGLMLAILAGFAVEYVRSKLIEVLTSKVVNGMYDVGLAASIGFTFLISGLSVVASYYGAKEVVESSYKAPTTWLASEERKAFEADKTANLEALKGEVKEYYDNAKRSWAGKTFIPKELELGYKAKQKALDDARKEWQDKEAQASKTFVDNSANTHNMHLSKKETVTVFIIICELMLLLAVAFSGYYQYRAFIELGELIEDDSIISTLEQQQQQKTKTPFSSLENQPFTLIRNNQNANHNETLVFGVGTCKKCGNEFAKRGPKHSFCSDTCRNSY